MAVVRAGKLIVCDTESERSLNWGTGQEIWCRDTDKLYIINDGAYVQINGGGGGSGLAQYQVRQLLRR